MNVVSGFQGNFPNQFCLSIRSEIGNLCGVILPKFGKEISPAEYESHCFVLCIDDSNRILNSYFKKLAQRFLANHKPVFVYSGNECRWHMISTVGENLNSCIKKNIGSETLPIKTIFQAYLPGFCDYLYEQSSPKNTGVIQTFPASVEVGMPNCGAGPVEEPPCQTAPDQTVAVIPTVKTGIDTKLGLFLS